MITNPFISRCCGRKDWRTWRGVLLSTRLPKWPNGSSPGNGNILMCGIAGIIHLEKKAEEEILRRMNSALTHRGPDDEGYWIHRNVGLAMRRLSIIDLDGGHQPLSNEAGNIWTVFNGEIYNFRELREELIQKGHSFQSRSDAESKGYPVGLQSRRFQKGGATSDCPLSAKESQSAGLGEI